jgi:hypothetical protein
VSPGDGKNVDLSKAENVTCKYIRIKKGKRLSSDKVFILPMYKTQV